MRIVPFPAWVLGKLGIPAPSFWLLLLAIAGIVGVCWLNLPRTETASHRCADRNGNSALCDGFGRVIGVYVRR